MHPASRRDLLFTWWESEGRRTIEQKPWMFAADGRWPQPAEALNPYGIWIAEVMLQQTQLAVMLPYWRRWMDAFPDLVALAQSDRQRVLLHWQGLGYYSRARRLHEAAGLLFESSAVARAPIRWPQSPDRG